MRKKGLTRVLDAMLSLIILISLATFAEYTFIRSSSTGLDTGIYEFKDNVNKIIVDSIENGYIYPYLEKKDVNGVYDLLRKSLTVNRNIKLAVKLSEYNTDNHELQEIGSAGPKLKVYTTMEYLIPLSNGENDMFYILEVQVGVER